MRIDFVQHLFSPFTNKPLQCEAFQSEIINGREHVRMGRLFTAEEEYPIIDYVPRILVTELLSSVLDHKPEFIIHFGNCFKSFSAARAADASQLSIEQHSQKSFGYQWNEFSEFYLQAWQDNFWMYVGKHLTKENFADKHVLDVGCGFGRHLYFAAKCGAKLAVGVDLSHAVDAAAKNLRNLDNVLIIQADVHNLPFRQAFDTAYTIGVLQHVTRPGEAIFKISQNIKPGGRFFAWVYGPRPRAYHIVVDNLRRVTTKMPVRMLYYFSLLLTIPSYILFVLPRKLLEKFGASRIAAKIPFSHYARYPFRVSHTDWFDRLGAPKTEYFTLETCRIFMSRSTLKEVSVEPRQGGGWLLFGSKV